MGNQSIIIMMIIIMLLFKIQSTINTKIGIRNQSIINTKID